MLEFSDCMFSNLSNIPINFTFIMFSHLHLFTLFHFHLYFSRSPICFVYPKLGSVSPKDLPESWQLVPCWGPSEADQWTLGSLFGTYPQSWKWDCGDDDDDDDGGGDDDDDTGDDQ